MKTDRRVFVIVLTFNGWEYTRACLMSVRRALGDADGVLVVDNGSSDGTITNLARDFPKIEVLRMPENRGWSGGNNAGLEIAHARGYAYALLLNNDATLCDGAVGHLVRAFDGRPELAMAGPKILSLGVPARLQFAGGFRKKTGAFVSRGYGEVDCGQYDRFCKTEWMNGCAALVNMKKVSRIGRICDDYFLRFEDVEWSLRARRAGFELAYVPAAVVRHAESAAFGGAGMNPMHAYYSFRNELMLCRRLDGGAQFCVRFACCLGNLLLEGLRAGANVRRALYAAVRDFLSGKTGPAGESVARLWQRKK